MEMDNKCPKCGKKLSFFYMKQNCPDCGTNLLYYGIEERLAEDAEKAQKEVDEFWRIIKKLDRARLVEKYYKKRGEPLPWEDFSEKETQVKQ